MTTAPPALAHPSCNRSHHLDPSRKVRRVTAIAYDAEIER